MLQGLDKQMLHRECLRIIQSKIADTQAIITAAGMSAQSETKSTAGDKHDTARAMAHLEQEKYATVLAQQQVAEDTLLRIHPHKASSTATLGSIVFTTNGIFYIAAPIGKCTVGGVDLFVLSATSPLARELQGKSKGDSFLMAGTIQTIMDVG
jgi:hypothetical protein